MWLDALSLNFYFMYERKTYTKHYFCFVMVTDKVLRLYMELAN